MAQTSLIRQLQKLAAPQTSLLKETKTRVSFLFDPREAAALDVDTAYAIGTTGLEELSTLNEAFSSFEENLFSENSKFFERAVKSREENTILDGQIEDFLLHLSPHFLLRPAHKALEWLVYRFHVHEYNVDALLRCILPFHETRVFARALQLLDLSSNTSKWHWLHCLQKPGLSLTKTALVTQCTRDPGTLKFVCEVLVAMAKVHSENPVALRPAIGLYASTVLGTLETMKKITDQTVAMMLPYILKGLAPSVTPDHRAATYLVVGQLARRSVLNREFAHELVVRVAKSLKPLSNSGASLSGGLLCLLVLMTLQGIEELPKASFQALVKHKKSLVAALEELSSKHSVSPILKPLLAQLTKSVLGSPRSEDEDGKKAAVLKALIQLALSLDKYSDFVVCLFFDTYIELHASTKASDSSEAADPASDGAVLDIMKMLRQRCPDEVDACLERHLCGDNEQARLAAEQLTRTNAFGREHALVEATGSALFLAMNSASKHHRVAAVRELVTALQKKQDVDEKFVRESLRSRLADTEPEVVQAVLALGKDFCNFVEQSFVLSILRRILFEPVEDSKNWFDLRTRALAFVCDDFCSVVDEGQLLATLLPFLMPTKRSEVSLARVAYASRALQRFPMFKTVTTDKRMTSALEAEDLDTITELLLADISEAVGKIDQPLVVVKTLEQVCFPSTGYAAAQLRCICGSLLNALASSTKDAEVFREALHFYQRLLAEKAACGEYDFAVAAVRDGCIPSAMVISGLSAVISGVEPVAALKENPMWVLKQQDEGTRATLDLLTNIFEMVAENSIVKSTCRLHFRQLLQKFFKVHCPSLKHQVHFLSGLWLLHLDANCSASSIDSQGVPAIHHKERLQSLALAVSIQLLREAEDIKWILAEKNLVFLSIILSLLSPTQGIRDLAVSLVEASVACSHKGRSGLHSLFQLITKHAADVSVGTKKLLKLIASWDTTLKKPNTLLVLLNHEQVPVAMRCGILKLVSRIDSKAMLEAAVKVIRATLGPEARDVAPTSSLPAAEARLLEACFAKYNLGAVNRLADIEGAVETLENALRSTKTCEGSDSVATMALQVVNKDLVKKLPQENQVALLDTLVDLALDTPPAVQHSAVLRALRKVCSFGSLLVEPLQRTSTSRQSPAKTVREAKKMRLMDASEEQDPAESPHWKRILILLEMIQSRKSIEDVSRLVAPLYALLKRSLELDQSPHAEYLRQCVLTCLQAHGLSAPWHELATLVKCLRHSQSAQAQQLSLVLLNLAAQKYPEEVLHNVTSVFTFMGASLLRLDDNYSFQTVMQTVETVVPALLQACAGESKSAEASESAVASVTRVFVGAFLDIPEHRRLPLFTKLATTLGAGDHLWVLAAQMGEHHVTKMVAAMETDESTSNILEFGLSLCGQFEVPVQMQTMTHLLSFAASLPAVKDNSNEPPSHPEVFDLRLYSDKQLQRFRLSVANFVANLLGSSTFLGQMAALQGGKGDQGTTEALCGPCLSACLQFVQHVSRWSNSPTKTPYQERVWKALLSKLHVVVHKVNGLLPSGQFVSVVRSLMCHELSSIRRSAMDMLNEKLAAKDYFAVEDTQSLLELVPMLLQMARGKSSSTVPVKPADGDKTSRATSSEEAALNRQTALLSLKLLIRTLGAEHRDAFAEVYDLAHELLSDERLNPLLMSSALLCFAELCHSLPTPTIAHFGRLMPPFLNILQEQSKEGSDVVTMALITALHRLVESLAPFLSAYLTTILVQVCLMHVSCTKETGSGIIGQRLESISTHIAHHVPARVLIPAIEESFHKLSHSAAALAPLMSVLGEFITSMEKADLKGHLPQLQELVLQLLSFRRDNPQMEDADVDTVETGIVGVVTSLSFKLSEVTFRPFFYKIYNWAAVEEPDKNKVLTFYHLTERLSEMLKSLFVLFAGVFVEHGADLLVATNSAKTEEDYFGNEAKSCRLLNHLLATLTACFHHGGKQFLTRERAAFLLKPLVNQVENELGGEEATQKRVERHLVPCLASFAAGCEDATRKEWHQKLLYQMRNSSAQVRYTTLLVFREAVRKLGDDYLSFLPEAVPFLAELMEDESTEVESLCQDVILEVEQILGEPLMKYF
ncbi:HEAT repeat-containing protein 1 [Dermacentor albipictus]|uniref:HEAT repeat-containing protein 1 n=1 Tax=Dermacentor albipictus TaxID=60249 RepID=UPI0031FE2883